MNPGRLRWGGKMVGKKETTQTPNLETIANLTQQTRGNKPIKRCQATISMSNRVYPTLTTRGLVSYQLRPVSRLPFVPFP